MTYDEALKNYMAYAEVMTSEGNVRYLESKAKITSEYFGSKEVTSIDRLSLLEFIKAQRNRNPNITNSTINKYIELVKRVLKQECGIKLVFAKLKEDKKTIEVVPQKVIDRIFSHYESNLNNKYYLRNYIMFRLLLETGLRITELLNLKIANIDYDLNVIHVQVTKIKEDRYVFFSSRTKELLKIFIYKYLITGYLLQNTKGEPLEYRTVDKMILRLKRKLQITQSISPHKWRHTFATRYISNGGDTASLQKILGHKSLSTTEKYLHLNVDILRKRYEETMNIKL